MNKKEFALSLVERFNDEGWDSLSPFFPDFNIFYKFLKRYGVQDEIDTNNFQDDQQENLFWASIVRTEPDGLDKVIEKFLSDIVIRDGDYYLYLRHRQEVAEFFKYGGGRYTSSRDIVEKFFSEGFYDFFDYYVNDVYGEVVSELSKENFTYLCKKIKDELYGREIAAETDLLMEIAESQGNKDFVKINDIETVEEIMTDSETANYILDEETPDLRSDLKNLYHNAYESAYTREVLDDIDDELRTFFEPDFIEEKVDLGNSKYKYNTYLKIKDKFVIRHIVLDYLETVNYNTLDYYSSFSGILQEVMERGSYDYLDFRVPEYANSKFVDEELNSMFNEYI